MDSNFYGNDMSELFRVTRNRFSNDITQKKLLAQKKLPDLMRTGQYN